MMVSSLLRWPFRKDIYNAFDMDSALGLFLSVLPKLLTVFFEIIMLCFESLVFLKMLRLNSDLLSVFSHISLSRQSRWIKVKMILLQLYYWSQTGVDNGSSSFCYTFSSSTWSFDYNLFSFAYPDLQSSKIFCLHKSQDPSMWIGHWLLKRHCLQMTKQSS